MTDAEWLLGVVVGCLFLVFDCWLLVCALVVGCHGRWLSSSSVSPLLSMSLLLLSSLLLFLSLSWPMLLLQAVYF